MIGTKIKFRTQGMEEYSDGVIEYINENGTYNIFSKNYGQIKFVPGYQIYALNAENLQFRKETIKISELLFLFE